MNKGLAIMYIYPDLKLGIDFRVMGEDNSIIWTTKTETQPTEAELESASVEVEKLQNIEDIKKQKSIDINKIASLSDQLNAMAKELMKLTKDSIDEETLEHREMFENIKLIRNK